MYTRIIFLSVISFLFTLNVSGQRETNIEKLNQLSEEFTEIWNIQEQRVQEYAAENNLEIRYETPDGVLYQMVDVRDGVPLYMATSNLGAAHTTRANELWEDGATGLELTGAEYDKLGEWDGGKVRVTHQEFTNLGASRVTQMDNTSGLHFHATHVAGTMVAGGVVANAKGMAYEGLLKAWDWNSDIAEMTAASAGGMEISNHSYGIPAGWVQNSSGQWNWNGNSNVSATEDYRFGFYEINSRYVDVIAFNAPNYLIVTSAGNQRGDGPANAGSGGNPEKNGGEDGFDCIAAHFAIAKNTLTVGAVKEVMDYSDPGSVIMTSFSSWGPADDGRIKPDVVAKGFSVYSTYENSNSAYGTLQGTSMSAPNTSGTLALLQQHYQNLSGGVPMLSATLKGLVIHTADEAGPDDGPDYMFGWGLVNAERASYIISDDQGQNVLDELVLEENDTYTREIVVPDGTPELRVTLCWTDPPAIPVSPQLDPTDIMLKNDLDVYITDSDGNTYYPFKLDPADPSAAATNDSKNDVDNVELISIIEPAGGTYTINIEHEDELTNDEQAYSLIITGIDEYTEAPGCAEVLLYPEDGGVNVIPSAEITWAAVPIASTYDVYFGTDGGGIDPPTNVYNGENFLTNSFSPVMDINTTYYLQVVPRNSTGPAEGCDVIWSFTTMDAITVFPYVEDIEDVELPDIPEFWSTQNYSTLDWLSTDLTSNSGDNAMGLFNDAGLIETDMDNWFVSPPLSLTGGLTYPISFQYRNFIPDHEESVSLYWGIAPQSGDLTNLLFEEIDFTASGWQLGEVPFIPSEDGIYFLGWYASSTGGYGVFLDDLMIDAGTVNINETLRDEVTIYSSLEKIYVDASEYWNGADLKVVNLMGQLVYSGRFTQPGHINIQSPTGEGLYFVSLQKDGKVFTKKLILSK